MSARDFLKLLLCGATIGPGIILCLQQSGVIYCLSQIEQGAVGIGAEVLAICVAVAWMIASERIEIVPLRPKSTGYGRKARRAMRSETDQAKQQQVAPPESVSADLLDHLYITLDNMAPAERRNAHWVMNPDWLAEIRKLDVHWPSPGPRQITLLGLPVETRDDGGCPHLEPLAS